MDRRSILKNAGIAGVLAKVQRLLFARPLCAGIQPPASPKSLDTISAVLKSCRNWSRPCRAASSRFRCTRWRADAHFRRGGCAAGTIPPMTWHRPLPAPLPADPIFAFQLRRALRGLTALQMNGWKDHGNGHNSLDAFFAKYNFKTASASNTTTDGRLVPRKSRPWKTSGSEDTSGQRRVRRASSQAGRGGAEHATGDVYRLWKRYAGRREFVGPYDDETEASTRLRLTTTTPGW